MQNIYVIWPVNWSYHWVDISAGGLLIPEGIIRPVVSAFALIWFITYIFNEICIS